MLQKGVLFRASRGHAEGIPPSVRYRVTLVVSRSRGARDLTTSTTVTSSEGHEQALLEDSPKHGPPVGTLCSC